MRMRYVAVALVLATTPVRSFAQTTGRAFTTQDALDVRAARISDVTEDGHWLAVTVQTRRDRSNVDHGRFGDPTYLAPSYGELIVIDAETGAQRSLFTERVQVREPTWSPNGDRLAFFKREGDAFGLYVHDVASNRTRAIRVRSDRSLSSASPLVWSPDGTSVLVTLRPSGWAEEARAAFLQLTEGPVVVQDGRDDFLDWERVRNLDRRQIPAMVSLRDGSVREVLPETPLQDGRFTTDGTQLVYTTAAPKRTSYERGQGTEYAAYRVTVAGGEPSVVVQPSERRRELVWNDGATAVAWAERGNILVRWLDADSAVTLTEAYREPVSDTDTTKLSFTVELWRQDGDALLVRSQRGLHVLDARGAGLSLAMPFEGTEEERPRIEPVAWSQDGNTLFLTTSARDRWERGLLRRDLSTGTTESLVADEAVYADWHVSEDGGRIVYRMSDGDRPDELYAADLSFRDVRRLTDLNPQLGEVALARTELVDYLDVDGNRLYGILYYPRGWEPGRPYPLVAEIYETFFDNGYNENMNLVTAQGWFGFRPSVHLEVGYPGEAWLKGVTAGINALIERGLVDEKRVGVYGQSYGGYAVNLLITQTDRFAAAVNVSGKVNIVSFLGDSPRIATRNYNAAEEGQDRIGATLWEQPQKYIAHSAVMFADRIETPLLLLSGEQDWNVPATNQREMYYALRRLGKEVVWVNYMKGGHGAGRASSPEDFTDHWSRMFVWFSEHFDEATRARTTADGGR